MGLVVDNQRRKRNVAVSCVAIVLLPLCLEGTTPNLTVLRDETAQVTQVLSYSDAQVSAALAQAPHLSTPLPEALRIGYPVPLAAYGSGAAVGDTRTLHFSGAEHKPPGDIVVRITASAPGHMASEVTKNETKLASWLQWTSLRSRLARGRCDPYVGDVDDALSAAAGPRLVFWAVAARGRTAGRRLYDRRQCDAAAMNAPWTAAEIVRAGALYVPLLLALAAGLFRFGRAHPRLFPAVLLSTLWTLPSLLLLQQGNLHAHWWSYAPAPATLRGMPLELFFGWAILWGVLPALTLPSTRKQWALPVAAALLGALDLVIMPRLRAAVVLHPNWLYGEAVALGLVLVPALLLAHTTRQNTWLRSRAALQLVLAAGLFLYLVPEIAFALQPGRHWRPLLALPRWQLDLALEILFLLALPGVSAIQEFVQRGRGTPIPYDPPTRLVLTGIYRYLANPMQFSCALVMVAWAALLRDVSLLLPAALAVVYSAGIARWDEREDLHRRFGQPWVDYRAAVRDWLPRLRPAGPAATIYFAQSCGACSEVRGWLERRQPSALAFLAAESLPYGSTDRLLYVPEDGASEQGTRAFARALEHIHLGYALAGFLLRLPSIAFLTQLVMDAAGFGPRTLPEQCSTFGQETAAGSLRE